MTVPKTVWTEDCSRVCDLLGASAESIKSDVSALKHWLYRQPHLAAGLTGVNKDEWLKNYLLMNKNNVERAKINLESYFRVRWILPELFQDRNMDSERMLMSFDNTCVAFMPGLTKEGYRVIVYSHFTDDATHFHPQDLAKRFFAIADIGLVEGVDRVSDILILDLANTRVSHLARYNLALLKQVFNHGWKAYPERVAAVHIVNPPAIMEVALGLFRPLLKQKMRDRIQIHKSVECLKEHIPLGSLPSDYGGDGPSCSEMNEAWRCKMVECRTLLETVAAHRSDETLRAGGRKCTASWSDLGLHGTFRRLTLD